MIKNFVNPFWNKNLLLQNAPYSQAQSYGQSGAEEHGYSGVKKEPNTWDAGYDQGMYRKILDRF